MCLKALTALSQETDIKYIGGELGSDIITGDLIFKNNIRGDVPSYYNMGMASKSLTTLCDTWYAGIKAEKFWVKNRFGISIGLRFTQIKSSVSNSANFFYLLYQQDGLNTEYLRISGITQTSDYIGIPVDMRIFAFNSDYSDYNIDLSKFYFKTGLVFNYRIQTKTSVTFYDSEMYPFKDNVANMVGNPKSFCLGFNFSVGYQYKMANASNINFEVSLPTAFFTRETSGLVRPLSGSGFQISIQLPINKITK
jgi:hypothetical protein